MADTPRPADVLRDHALGIVQHRYMGSCPDALEGPDVRDPECPVCQALATPPADGEDVDLEALPVRERDRLVAATLRFMRDRGYTVTHPGAPADVTERMLRADLGGLRRVLADLADEAATVAADDTRLLALVREARGWVAEYAEPADVTEQAREEADRRYPLPIDRNNPAQRKRIGDGTVEGVAQVAFVAGAAWAAARHTSEAEAGARAWDEAVAMCCQMLGVPNVNWPNPYRAAALRAGGSA